MPENDTTDTQPNKPVGITQPIGNIPPVPDEKTSTVKKFSRWLALLLLLSY